MPDLAVQEVYVSTKSQKIFGEVYSPGEVIPNAEMIPTLPALLSTKCIERHAMAVQVDPETNKVEDLGSSEFNVAVESQAGEDNGKGAKKKKRKYTRRKKKTVV